jgi:hypothetical protein
MLKGELKYNDNRHEYSIGGIVVPGVTGVIDSAGFISEYAKDETSRKLGTIFHKTQKLFLRGQLIGVDPNFKEAGWMGAIEKFWSEQQPTPYIDRDRGIERVLFSQRFGFAGTIDYIGMIKRYGTDLCIIDWKTCSSIANRSLQWKAYKMQLAAYRILFREYEQYSGKIRLLVVHFKPNDYEILPIDEPSAETAFLSALNLCKYKKGA